jgi:hypothetical protein
MNLKLKPSYKTYYNGLYYKIKIKDSLDMEELDELYHGKKGGHPVMSWSDKNSKMQAPTSKNVHCYLYNEEQVKSFLDTVDNKKIDYIQGPINDYHKKLLNDMGIEVKNTLYYKKYRYRIDFGLLNKDEVDVSSFLLMLRQMVSNDKENFLGQHIYQTQLGWAWPRIYLTGDEQLMIVKLSSEERIKQITKVVTVKEIIQHG